MYSHNFLANYREVHLHLQRNYIQLSGFGFKKIRILHWGNEEQH